jgi:hypothetical protein
LNRGILKISEVVSRIEDKLQFIRSIESLGFKLVNNNNKDVNILNYTLIKFNKINQFGFLFKRLTINPKKKIIFIFLTLLKYQDQVIKKLR